MVDFPARGHSPPWLYTISSASKWIYVRAIQTANEFFSLLKQESSFDIEKIPNGSNIFKLIVRGTDLETFRDNLRTKGVLLSRPRPELGGFLVGVNATLNRTDAGTLVKMFKENV